MNDIQLTKRQYLGESHVHAFRHNETGEIKWVQCSKDEYVRMTLHGGSKHNPTLDGYTWVASYGGSVLVDSEDGVLGENEYCEIGDEVIIKLKDVPQEYMIQRIPKGKIVARDKVRRSDLSL